MTALHPVYFNTYQTGNIAVNCVAFLIFLMV